MSGRTFAGEKYATQTLVTDTLAYDVIRHTAKTITVRRRKSDGPSRRDMHVDQGPFPVIWTGTSSDLDAEARVLRLRKDGTYRLGDWANPLRFTDEEPETRVDYRF